MVRTLPLSPRRPLGAGIVRALLAVLILAGSGAATWAAEHAPGTPPPEHKGGGEASLILPDLNKAKFLGNSIGGKDLLYVGLVVAACGLGFGLVVYSQLKNLPVHQSMLDVSELIYATCKTYLFTQGKFLAILWFFIGTIIVFYFKFLQKLDTEKVGIILLFSVIGILGSYGSRGSASGSTRSPTPGRRSAVWPGKPSHATRSRSRPGSASACCSSRSNCS
ncbi:Pyrophosphate-energized proton pump [Fimbriiglobus ruber]|uniref:Pyrophosphate-energized proton pump n=1 Tax=Fimbriiglobus ruber TaxID=1908690 RepID=A0A225DT32_9BACT|nr:Pyrophosphate-energized proton pump [Fimbriiglobus ruber]